VARRPLGCPWRLRTTRRAVGARAGRLVPGTREKSRQPPNDSRDHGIDTAPVLDRYELAVRAGGHVAEGQHAGKDVRRRLELRAQDVGKPTFFGFEDGAGVMCDQPAQHGVGVLGVVQLTGAVECVQARRGQVGRVADVVQPRDGFQEIGVRRLCADPAGGMHAYFTGSDQLNGRLPSHHLDFRSQGGYIVAPPFQVDGEPYRIIGKPGGRGGLDWAAVTRLLEPQRSRQRLAPGQVPDRDLSQLARWVASQPEGNRNAGLYWAANHALDAGPAADLSPLAAAARQAGLGEPEITRTLDSARRTRQAHHQTEGVN
jgi:hypothetical protein